MFLMRLFFWKQSSKKSRKTTICTLYVYSRFFYFVKSLNLLALEDIGVDAKEINEKRAQAKEAKMIADAKAFLESCEEKDA